MAPSEAASKSSRRVIRPAAKATAQEQSVATEYVTRSVRTGKVLTCVFHGEAFRRSSESYLVGYIAPPYRRDRLYRADGVTDKEWARALPVLLDILSKHGDVSSALWGPVSSSLTRAAVRRRASMSGHR